jgi:hypothetical protein
MLETVICWTNYILNICIVLLFQVLNVPSNFRPFEINYGPSKAHKDYDFAKLGKKVA